MKVWKCYVYTPGRYVSPDRYDFLVTLIYLQIVKIFSVAFWKKSLANGGEH